MGENLETLVHETRTQYNVKKSCSLATLGFFFFFLNIVWLKVISVDADFWKELPYCGRFTAMPAKSEK